MHVPDGFLDLTTSAATGVVAVGGIAAALRGARSELDDRTAPLAGLAAVFVFAGQMINFPVGVGTSGHLLGGALAALLVGPWTATLCVSVVLVVQALLFGDGGLTALGTNITLMAIVGVWAAWGAYRLGTALLPRRVGVLPGVAFVAGLVSVPVAALAFCALYAVGGQAPLDFSTLVAVMVGWHTVIGLGEGVITALVVSSVLAVRPDLVRGARPYRSPADLEIRSGVRA
ncbi:MAG: energy-coupling factor ABC transporter permease [Ornithinimicrobium sp.]|jgi:cobalt/nickel transport system permease protein|uniref:energy-coupling factor ABC transporter permease n=1 Tax=Ornithinimicrobium sp. TaxID=1977084 RepID=UPI003D9AF93C